MYRGVQFVVGTSTVTTETTEHYENFNLFHLQFTIEHDWST